MELPSAGARNDKDPVPAWITAAAAALAAAGAVAVLQARRRMSPG
jgi:hypothetical protein